VLTVAASGIPNPCDVAEFGVGQICDIPGAIKGAASTAAATAQFMQDPFGYIAEKMQAAASELTATVLPNLEAVTHPQLDRDWFVSTYRVSFALALLVFVVFVGWNFVELSRRRISGDDLMETLGFYVPVFLGGALLGPAAGQFLLSFTGALSDSVAAWGIGGSTTEVTTRLQQVIADGDPATITGGAFVAILFFFALIIGLLLAFAVLVVMLVTLYLTGAILPLSLVWLVHPHRRGRGLKIVSVWLGICFSHVLLFLLLGASFKMVAEFTSLTTPAGRATAAGGGGGGPGAVGAGAAGAGGSGAPPSLQTLVNLAVAVIALFMSALAPFGLLRFAPVGPTSGGSGPSVPVQRGARGGRPIGGHPESATDSQMSQAARANSRVMAGGGGGGEDEAGWQGGGRDGWGLQPSGEGLAERYATERQARAGGGAGAGGGDEAGATGGSASGAPMAGGSPPTATSAPGLGPTSGAASVAGGAGASSGGTSAAGGGAAAGAAAGAAGLGLAALGGAAKAAESAGDMAADHMEHGDGPEGLHPRHN
jgi:type IV secretion system protein TrbL